MSVNLPQLVANKDLTESEGIRKPSMENTSLTEIITIYERMQKGRAQDAVFRVSKFGLPTSIEVDNQIVEETVALVPSFYDAEADSTSNLSTISDYDVPKSGRRARNFGGAGAGNSGFGSGSPIGYRSQSPVRTNTTTSTPRYYQQDTLIMVPPSPMNKRCQSPNIFDTNSTNNATSASNVLDFNKYKYLQPEKYIFFSKETNLIQSNLLEGLSKDYVQLLKSKNYWLNILDPSESDLSILFSSFNVHDLTISDIREGNTEEKIEIFKHYTFISMRLMCESIKEHSEDMDFNILLFKDFVITIHDKKWDSIKDVLGFVNLLTSTPNTVLTPDWVLFSVFIELAQDAQYLIDTMEPEINSIRIGSKSLNEMSDVMRRIFDMEFQIYTISRFLKPKTNILRTLKTKCAKRLSKIVIRLIGDIRDDFKEISHDLEILDHILERSQDTFLALVNVEKSREANEMSKVMKRISEIALVFLPIQAISGFFGMNVLVPYQDEPTTMYFWFIVGGSILLAITAYFLRTVLLTKSVSFLNCNKRDDRQSNCNGSIKDDNISNISSLMDKYNSIDTFPLYRDRDRV